MFEYKLLFIPLVAVISYWIRNEAKQWYYKTYANHITFAHHSSSRTMLDQWLTLKMLSIITLMILVWLVIGKGGLFVNYYGQLFFGMLILGYTSSIGISLASLFIFKYAHYNKESLQGHVIIKAPLARQIALGIATIPLFSLAPCMLAAPDPFITGGAIGILINIFLQTFSHFTPIVF